MKSCDDMSRILITIPTWNEASIIERTLTTLGDACARLLSEHDVTIEVADNGSTDATSDVVRSTPYALRPTPTRGKGMAIKSSWLAHSNDSDVFVFLDADLAADLNALPRLIRPIVDGTADLVCGSRFLPGATVERKASRELASRLFRHLQRFVLHLPVEDAHCGFKAASARLVRDVVPHCDETGWMFDSELIARTANAGLIIKEIPVSWIEHRDPSRRSALGLWRHGFGFIIGLFRIRVKSH